MANERTYPCLPCADLDESVAFYAALGFTRTYRQLRPNPYAVVALEDIHIHLFGMAGFIAAESYGTAIVVVPDLSLTLIKARRIGGFMATLNILPKSSSRKATWLRNQGLSGSRISQNLFISNEVRWRRGASAPGIWPVARL